MGAALGGHLADCTDSLKERDVNALDKCNSSETAVVIFPREG